MLVLVLYRSTVLPMYGRVCSHYLAGERGGLAILDLIFGNQEQEQRKEVSNPSDAPFINTGAKKESVQPQRCAFDHNTGRGPERRLLARCGRGARLLF